MPGTKNTNQQKAVVLLSGGMDSCVCAAIAVKNHGAENVALLHAGYGQRTQQRERRGFRIHRRLLRHNTTPGSPARSFPRHRRLGAHRRQYRRPGKSTFRKQQRNSRTYVPFRNAHFLSVAVSWAEVIGAQIYLHRRRRRRQFRLSRLPPRVLPRIPGTCPRRHAPETQIAISHPCYLPQKERNHPQRASSLGAPLHLTWSCYQNEHLACGVCDSCVLRLRAFAEAGLCDPISYGLAAARS